MKKVVRFANLSFRNLIEKKTDSSIFKDMNEKERDCHFEFIYIDGNLVMMLKTWSKVFYGHTITS